MLVDVFNKILGTVFGGLIFTFFIFVLNEHCFTVKDLTGVWEMQTTTEETAYNKYKGMQLVYNVHLLQKGDEVIGSGEKRKEIVNQVEQQYTSSQIVTATIEGYYKRQFLAKDLVNLYIIEDGTNRESRISCALKFINEDKIVGEFYSTAAQSIGVVTMQRK